MSTPSGTPSAISTGRRITFSTLAGSCVILAFGEGDYARQEQVIQQLLQESKA